MKRSLHLLALLLLVACTSQTQNNSTNTPESLVTQSPEPPDIVPTVVATASSTPISPAQQPIATTSDVPFTSTSVASTPEPVSTNLPVPTGRIVFLWNPYLIPPDDQRGVDEITRTNLYSVVPDLIPDNWQIETVMEMIGQPTMTLAPDRSKLAIIKYDDTNEDGFIDTRRGYDVINIYTYALDSRIFAPLTDNQFSTLAVSWLPDSQNLVYSQQNAIFVTNSQTTLANEQLEIDFPDYITGLALSPDGNTLAVNRFPNNLDFYGMGTNQITPIAEINYGYQLNLKWSLDSQWLAFTRIFNDGLFIVNGSTRQVTEIYDTGLVFPVWSPDEPLLAFTYNATLFLWDGNTKTQRDLISRDYLGEPVWSPNGTELAVGFSEGDRGGILIFNLISGEWRELIFEAYASQIIWSPDGEWLLFSSYLEGKAGLFVINLAVGQPYLFLDTTGKNFPYNIFWLENS